MPEFDSPTRTKIAMLRALYVGGTRPEAYELVKIDWPEPTGAIYYAVLQTDEVASVPPPVSPIETRLIPEDSPGWFLPVAMDATIGDEEADLPFWDGDGEISDLVILHGEGVKVELFYWFPQVELLLPLWHGHLRNEDEAEVDLIPLKAVQGFRSADGDLPSRAHYSYCQRVFGGLLETQEEIDEHGCPYNKHLGGLIGTLDPDTGEPWTFCPRRTTGDCSDRGVNPLRHMSHRTIVATTLNAQTHGPNLFSTSHGNESNLKEPVRVVMGVRRIYDMPPMVYRRDFNNNNPDHGFFDALYEACEGPLENILFVRVTVGGKTQYASGSILGLRLGNEEDVPASNQLSTHGFAATAHIRYIFGWVNPADVDPNDCRATIATHGLRNIRIYTDQTTYSENSTDNRVWHIARMMCDKRWGVGYDYQRLGMTSWIDAAAWISEGIRFIDGNGDIRDHVRGWSNVELFAKKSQQQVDDMCLAGRLSRPFLFDGKIHIQPLRVLTDEEFDECPEFTDEGDSPNIVWEDDRSTLKTSRKSDIDLPNRVETVYDSAANDYIETPAPPVEDVDQQLRAGRVVGDKARKVVTKKYSLLGVVVEHQAVKIATALLDLGPHDEGGLKNNCRLTFRIWFIDALDLHPAKVIKVTSARVQKYGFTHFRILKIERQENLEVELTVQAYNHEYMQAFEVRLVDIPGPPPDPDPPPPPGPNPIPCELEFGPITYENGVLTIPIPTC